MSTENKNIIDQAKGFIHNAVMTDEQRKAEKGAEQASKPVTEQIRESLPANASEVGAKLDEAAGKVKTAATDAAEKAQGTADEKKEEAKEGFGGLVDSAKGNLEGLKDATGAKILEAREHLADATKPQEK